MSTVDWTGPCPKCGYVRTAQDTNPAWQCPRCQIAYAKYVPAAPAPVHERLAAHASAMADRASSDHSLAGLVVTNIFALVVAWFTGMTLRDLMLVYWIQSVVIGLSNVVRILKLHDFSTRGMTMNDRPIPETPVGKREVAGFFVMHYGLFHAVYFVFITSGHHGQLGHPLSYVLVALSFIVNHAFSLKHNLESDASGRPNLGALMFMPYLRIIPMHITIVTGAFLGSSPFGFLLFGGLKTVADGVMHTVEHHILAQNQLQAQEAAEVLVENASSDSARQR